MVKWYHTWLLTKYPRFDSWRESSQQQARICASRYSQKGEDALLKLEKELDEREQLLNAAEGRLDKRITKLDHNILAKELSRSLNEHDPEEACIDKDCFQYQKHGMSAFTIRRRRCLIGRVQHFSGLVFE